MTKMPPAIIRNTDMTPDITYLDLYVDKNRVIIPSMLISSLLKKDGIGEEPHFV
jgi:hypothetical protein